MRIDRINTILTNALTPSHLHLTDESAQHAGHLGVKEMLHGRNGNQSSHDQDGHQHGIQPQINSLETHFSLEISATALVGLSRVLQHQTIYNLLKNEFLTGLHSLRIRVV